MHQVGSRESKNKPQTYFALKPLQRGIMLVMLGVAIVAPINFVAITPAQAETLQQLQSFTIPAGSMESALAAFSAQSGVNISFSPEVVKGKSSSGLNGQFQVNDALGKLLAGSGLQAKMEGSGSYSILKSTIVESNESLTLPTVKVAGLRDPATEGTGSYTTHSTDTATGLGLSFRETPQSVSVLTRSQIDDFGLITLDDAVRNITGLVMQKGYDAGDSGSFSARGFPVSNLMLDGLPISTGANGTFNADNDDLAIYDRIEVVRGATGLLTGAGTPSAAINLVRKRPTTEFQGKVTASLGSWDNLRLQFDSSGALNEAKTIRGRTVITVQDRDNFYDVYDERNKQFYAIVEADLTPQTLATIGFHYRDVDVDGFWQGLPTEADGSYLSGISRSTNLSNDFDYWRQTDRTFFAELEQKFGEGWTAKIAANWKRPEQNIQLTGLHLINDNFHQSTQHYRLDNTQDSYDLSINGPFTLLGREHELIVGVGHRRFSNNNWGGWADYSWTAAGPLVDPYNWDSSSVVEPEIDMTLWGIDTVTKQTGVYAATRLNLSERWMAVLGSRISWYEFIDHRNVTGYKVNEEVVPYAGLIYELDNNHSIYTSWTEIFEPQDTLDRNGSLLEPITGTNAEVGIKGEYFDGGLNASLALFQVTQQNRATDDLSGPNPCPGSWGFCQRASGEIESNGIELELSGALTPNWQMMAGYTYVSAKYTKDANKENVGRLYDTDLPRHLFKLATNYQLSGDLNQWRVGGNIYAQNSTYTKTSAYKIEQGAYAVLGLHVGYRINPKTDLQLNINNVFDKEYYQSIGWSEGAIFMEHHVISCLP